MEIGSSQHKAGGLIMGLGYEWPKALFGKIKGNLCEAVQNTKKLGQDDPRRIIHSLKVALALTLISFFYYVRPLYDGFGSAGMWALLTVVVVFEFTVGGTLSKGMNRAFATFSGGALGVGANYLAALLGEKGEPFLLGSFVFLLGGTSTFIRFFPKIKRRYDYGVLIFILTFCMVTVSGYRAEDVVDLAHKRLSTIIVGGACCMLISLFICPVWAGQDLQKLIALNIENLATFLQGFGGEYFKQYSEDNDHVSSKVKSSLEGYKSVLNSKSTEESLANFAWWEPGHGSFKLHHPWSHYLKMGVLIRQCAFHLEALNGYLTTDLQAPSQLKRMIQEPCTRISSESGKALKEIASSLRNMTRPSSTTASHIRNCKEAIDDLKDVLGASSLLKADLMEIISTVTVASLLIDVSNCVDKILESVLELSEKASFKPTKKPENLQIIRRSAVKPLDEGENVIITVTGHGAPENENPHVPKQSGN